MKNVILGLITTAAIFMTGCTTSPTPSTKAIYKSETVDGKLQEKVFILSDNNMTARGLFERSADKFDSNYIDSFAMSATIIDAMGYKYYSISSELKEIEKHYTKRHVTDAKGAIDSCLSGEGSVDKGFGLNDLTVGCESIQMEWGERLFMLADVQHKTVRYWITPKNNFVADHVTFKVSDVLAEPRVQASLERNKVLFDKLRKEYEAKRTK